MNLEDIFKKNNIDIEDDVYRYGSKILKNYLMIFSVSLFFSICFNTFFETILLILCFLSIRKYSGGFHFDSEYLCNIFSTILIIVIPFVAKSYSVNNHMKIVIFILLLIFTSIIGPVDHPNKKITTGEKEYFKKLSFVVEVILFSLMEIFAMLRFDTFSNIISFVFILSILNLTISKIHQ